MEKFDEKVFLVYYSKPNEKDVLHSVYRHYDDAAKICNTLDTFSRNQGLKTVFWIDEKPVN